MTRTAAKPRKGQVYVDYLRLSDLEGRRWPGNPKEHDQAGIQGSILQHGYADPLMLDEGTGRLVKGHGRLDGVIALKAAGQLPPDGVLTDADGEWLLPVNRGKRWPTPGDAEAYLLADNQLTIAGGWNLPGLGDSLRRLALLRVPVMNLGWGTDQLRALSAHQAPGDADPSGAPPTVTLDTSTPGMLATRFVVPPFSVLDARQGYWQDRKQTWARLGIESEQGRGVTLKGLISATQFQEQAYDARRGKEVDAHDKRSGTSIFDPVLCELVYRWFCAPGAKVVDPFAGGSVRGVVAGALGRAYTGVDLRAEQIDANRAQWATIGARAAAAVAAQVDPPAPLVIGDPAALTPVQRLGDVWAKRDDLFEVGGVWGGKVRTCWALAQGAKGLVTAGSLASPQVNIVAHVAKALGIPCRVHSPTGKVSPEVQAAVAAGAQLVQHKPGYNSVIVARARVDAQATGYVEIPFGMECLEAVRQTRGQVRQLPAGIKRVVIPVGSGMSLAGLLWGLQDAQLHLPVIGVQVGADPTKRLDKFAPQGWRDRVQLVQSGSDYHKPAAVTDLHGLALDPYYEAKCLPHLQPDDLFWVVGVRQVVRLGQTATPAPVSQSLVPVAPQWVVGDSRMIMQLAPGHYDLLFTCPPYADLEVYSDDERDISRLDYADFLVAYREIIARGLSMLRQDRFAAIVVGDVRDTAGCYRNFVSDTIAAFRDAGAQLYNEAILVTPVGSLPVRAGRQFAAGRKLGKTHQQLLVFVKGDPAKATAACGPVDVSFPDGMDLDAGDDTPPG